MDDLTLLAVVAVSVAVISVVGIGAFTADKIFDAAGGVYNDVLDTNFRAGGTGAQGWLFLFGSDLYNPSGYTRFAFYALVNNAKTLFQEFGLFETYYATLPVATQRLLGVYRADANNVLRFYPNTFWVRQNLCSLPFSKALWGPYQTSYTPGSCLSLKEFVQSAWDELPAMAAKAEAGPLSGLEKFQNGLRSLIAEDEELNAKLKANNDGRARIVDDRIQAMRALLYVPLTRLGLTVAEEIKLGDAAVAAADTATAALSEALSRKPLTPLGLTLDQKTKVAEEFTAAANAAANAFANTRLTALNAPPTLPPSALLVPAPLSYQTSTPTTLGRPLSPLSQPPLPNSPLTPLGLTLDQKTAVAQGFIAAANTATAAVANSRLTALQPPPALAPSLLLVPAPLADSPLSDLAGPLAALNQAPAALSQSLTTLGQSLASLGRPLTDLSRPLTDLGQPLTPLSQPLTPLGLPLDKKIGIGQKFIDAANDAARKAAEAMGGK